ncbi:MAG: polymer-forming cytoskeletal protein [Gammaproteobacteria bacterium]|nr:polymer-forming cytoskeletal protein [Gammaproteobacteria bacterium]
MSAEDNGPPTMENKRRFLDRRSQPATVIAAGTVIVGNIQGAGPFAIAGEIRGDGDLAGQLNIESGGAWHGNIRARQALVSGKIVGSLRVDDKLEIGRTAEIRGSVSARSVAIARGAIVDGGIEVTSGGSVVEFEDKRRG